MADKISNHASILGHESERVVTPAGLKAWARGEGAEARGGELEWPAGVVQEGMALSAYTWCRTNKGPQNEWLFKIGKADSDRCKCEDADDRDTRRGRVSRTGSVETT